jgi:hypothetical protein
MSTIQVRNINFEPTGNNRITYETSNGYFAIVLGGNRVLDFASGNVNFVTSGFSVNNSTSNTLSVANTFSANGSVGSNNQVLISQGPDRPVIWSNSSVSVNSTSIIGGTTNRLLFNSGNTVRETTGITTDGVTLTLTGSSSALSGVLNDVAEVVNVSATAATGNINFDITTQSVLFYTTNASGNWTLNFRASSGTTLNTLMSTGQSLTAAFLVTNGATAYFNNFVQVDGTASGVTTRWQGGAAPTAGNASSVDAYVYTIIKTGSATYSVFASQTRFA